MQEISNSIWQNINPRIKEVIEFLANINGKQNYDHFETPLTTSMDFHPDDGRQLVFDPRPLKWRVEGDFGIVLYEDDKDVWASDGAMRKLVLYHLPEKRKPFEIASVCYLKRHSTNKVFRSIALGQTLQEGRVMSFDAAISFERVCTVAIRFVHAVTEMIENAS
jgi:hypothetical protein